MRKGLYDLEVGPCKVDFLEIKGNWDSLSHIQTSSEKGNLLLLYMFLSEIRERSFTFL